jgi:hypothetical protein
MTLASFVKGEGFVLAPKRTALGIHSDSKINSKEIAEAMLAFWKKHRSKSWRTS